MYTGSAPKCSWTRVLPFLTSSSAYCIAVFAAASLRMQSDPANKDFDGLSPERAYADYVLANMVLFLAAWNYIG
jgi:oligosaccharyltransferase complex subunit epsilon